MKNQNEEAQPCRTKHKSCDRARLKELVPEGECFVSLIICPGGRLSPNPIGDVFHCSSSSQKTEEYTRKDNKETSMGDTIVGVQFGIANPEDIRKRSVVEVTTDKTYQSNQPVPNGVFDSRFGVIENGKVCPTCKQTNQFCPGHFGHITLARPVYLYQFFDIIEKLCNVVCLSCSKPFPHESPASKGAARFKAIRDAVTGTKRPMTCPVCDTAVFTKVSKAVG